MYMYVIVAQSLTVDGQLTQLSVRVVKQIKI